jgi:primase-polymerase (primpol)-like protein
VIDEKMEDKQNFLKPISEMIPQELKDWVHWVCWMAEYRGGKWTKVPYNPNNCRKAKSNDPSTWASFKLAYHQYWQNGYDGIGYMLSNDDPFTGFDFDHCRNPKTGDIELKIQEYVDRLNSYTEISPSGKGIRIFVKAKLPEGRRKNGNIEVYNTGRYLTLTGHRIK